MSARGGLRVVAVIGALAGIAETGVSILVVEQFARTALRVADYAAVMVGGRIVATGEPDEINEKMSDVILGGAA